MVTAKTPAICRGDAVSQLGELDRLRPHFFEEVIAALGRCRGNSDKQTVITAEIMEALPDLKYIGVLATGYNVVNMMPPAKKVSWLPTSRHTARHLWRRWFCTHLEHCSASAASFRGSTQRRWTNNADFCFWDTPLIELARRKIDWWDWVIRVSTPPASPLVLACRLRLILPNHLCNCRLKSRSARWMSSSANATSLVYIARLPTRPKNWSTLSVFV